MAPCRRPTRARSGGAARPSAARLGDQLGLERCTIDGDAASVLDDSPPGDDEQREVPLGHARQQEIDRVDPVEDEVGGHVCEVENQDVGRRAGNDPPAAVIADHRAPAVDAGGAEKPLGRQHRFAAEAALHGIEEAHLAQHVLVVVERHAIEPDAERQAGGDELGDRRDSRAQPEVG